MGDMESRSLASALMEGCRPKDPPMRNTRCPTPWLAQAAICRASASLDRGSPSTHRAIRAAPDGSLARMAAASFKRAASIWAGEGASGSRSSGSSTSSSLQKRDSRLTYSAAASI